MLHFTIFRKKIVTLSLGRCRRERPALIKICALVLFAVASLRLAATPINNITDTQMFHTVQGTDKFYTKKQKGEIRLHLSPYFQHAGAARDNKGRRVPLGERVGKWNMSGLFFGQGAMPAGKTLASPEYAALSTASVALAAVPAGGWTIEEPTKKPLYTNLATEANFNTDVNAPAYFSVVDVKHEKLGLRGQVSCDFGFGLGISVKGGVVDYKERPNFDIGHNFRMALGLDQAGTGETLPGDKEKEAVNVLYNNFFSPTVREKLFKAVGLDVSEIRQTCLEDMHMQLFWHFPYEMKEKGELSVTMIPCMAIGAWLPTSQVKDQDKAFSIDTGNSGFYGLTFEGSLGFDFPKLLQTSFGGGVVVSMSKEFNNYRVPSAAANTPIKQSGFYPWKTTIGRTPGVTWYGNASFKADGFSDALSLYFDYIYTYHQKDTIVLRETDTRRRDAFALGVLKLEEESNWKTQLLNIGLDYRINPHLSFGGAVQAMIGGVRVFKTTTFLGSMTLTF